MHFREEQRFTGRALKVLTTGLLVPIPVVATLLFIAIPGLRDNPGPLAIVFGLVFLVDLIFWSVVLRTRLVVEVEDDRLGVAVRPFTRRVIPADRIERCDRLDRGLFRRYGAGIGKRRGDKRARYTVGNDAGVVLTLTDGWTVVLGSNRAEELGRAITELALRQAS